MCEEVVAVAFICRDASMGFLKEGGVLPAIGVSSDLGFFAAGSDKAAAWSPEKEKRRERERVRERG